MTEDENEIEEKYSKRKILVSARIEVNEKQEQHLLDMATEYMKQIKAIANEAELVFYFVNA